jgi:hypothetical protein
MMKHEELQTHLKTKIEDLTPLDHAILSASVSLERRHPKDWNQLSEPIRQKLKVGNPEGFSDILEHHPEMFRNHPVLKHMENVAWHLMLKKRGISRT